MKLKALMNANETDREKLISAFLTSSQNCPAPTVDREIEQFEKRFGMSTCDLKKKLESGELDETESFCNWLMLADIRDQQ